MKAIVLSMLCLASTSFVVATASAAPAITSLSGTVSHGNSLNLSGSAFGVKTPASPAVWDDCSGTSVTALWSGGWPNNARSYPGCNPDPTSNLAYRTPINGVDLPHSHIAKYLAGRHADAWDCQTGARGGYDVMVWKTITVSLPQTIYASFYETADPGWDGALGSPQDNNYKFFDYSNGSSPYTTNTATDSNWYINYGVPNNLASPETVINDDGGTLQNPDANGHSYWWEGNANLLGHWVKRDFEVRLTSDNSGYIKVWENGVLVVDYAGRTDAYTGKIKTVGLGGYARAQGGPAQWRYFADLYFDTTAARVLICRNATWSQHSLCETQVPTAWSVNHITFTVNQGAFGGASNAYVYVVDPNGAANANGYPVTFGGSNNETKPASPNGLKVR